VGVDGVLSRLKNLRVVAQTKVVVGAKVEHRSLTLLDTNRSLLGSCNHALLLVGTSVNDSVKLALDVGVKAGRRLAGHVANRNPRGRASSRAKVCRNSVEAVHDSFSYKLCLSFE